MTVATQGPQVRKVDIIHASAQVMPQSAAARPALLFCLAPALASSLLLWMSFFPLAWGWLGWVALVPLLCLVRARASSRRIYWCAYAAGSAFFWPALWWMPVNSHMIGAWALLSMYCALYFPAAIWLIRRFDRHTPLPLVLSVPIVWTALEFVRSFLLTGFAWYYLGHTQHAMLSLIQIADLGGVYLISFLVAAVNAWLFDLLYQLPGLRDLCHWEEPKHLDAATAPLAGGSMWRPGLKYEAGLLLIAFVCTLIYGAWRLGQDRFEQGPLLALLQTNLGQGIRETAKDDNERKTNLQEVARHADQLCKSAVNQPVMPDLIVWPETSYFLYWSEVSPELAVEKIPEPIMREEAFIREHLRDVLTNVYPTSHLLGLTAFYLNADAKESRFNSALFVRKGGRIAGRYDKIHRVPFGEYVPLKGWIPFVEAVSPYEGDFGIVAGEKHTRFELGKHKFGVLICYEDTDPFMARRYVRPDADGAAVDFLINMSNDGWFEGGSEHDEHLAISRFRAIECRRAVARSVNMGITAIIDGNGRVLRPEEVPPPSEPHTWKIGDAEDLPVAEWSSYKKTSGVLLARVPLDTRESFYAKSGDVMPSACCVLVGGVMLWSFARRRRSAVPSAA
jgi:apolipoprotein N-acyltransferase